MDNIYFSEAGYDSFVKKLEAYKRESSSKTQEEFDGAQGGESSVWHDNFEFEQATISMNMRASEIERLQDIIRKAIVIQIRDQIKKVTIGNTVEIEFDNGETKEITIGAYGESSPEKNLIAYQAPIAKAIMGKKEGDETTFTVQKNARTIYISKIHPASYKYHQLIKDLLGENLS